MQDRRRGSAQPRTATTTWTRAAHQSHRAPEVGTPARVHAARPHYIASKTLTLTQLSAVRSAITQTNRAADHSCRLILSRTPSIPPSEGVAYGTKRCCPRMGTASSGRIAALDRGEVEARRRLARHATGPSPTSPLPGGRRLPP